MSLATAFAAPKHEAPDLFDHQHVTSKFILDNPRAFIMNEPGTGKTVSVLHAFNERKKSVSDSKLLVLAPKAILECAWKADAERFFPNLKVSVAYSNKRAEAFRADADVYITNHDAASWLVENSWAFKNTDVFNVDESTAYKNRAAKRSKAIAKVAMHFQLRQMMSGTPMPQGIEDLWHQMFLLDDGERLGDNFFRFRNATHEPTQVGPDPRMQRWDEKPGAREAVADLISDITILYRLEDCIDMPGSFETLREYPLPKKLRKIYEDMVKHCVLQIEENEITAVHAAALRTKLLQICSGAVYEGPGKYHVLDDTRYNIIAELMAEREASVCAFLWSHQKHELKKALLRAGVKNIGVIDGSTKNTTEVVDRFQNGDYQALLAHPQSTSHGLTLTRANTLIWASPTDSGERFEQFNRRIYRAGQTKRCEYIHTLAKDTVDEGAFQQTSGKLERQLDLLQLLRAFG